jgi:hypothetical protein
MPEADSHVSFIGDVETRCKYIRITVGFIVPCGVYSSERPVALASPRNPEPHKFEQFAARRTGWGQIKVPKRG